MARPAIKQRDPMAKRESPHDEVLGLDLIRSNLDKVAKDVVSGGQSLYNLGSQSVERVKQGFGKVKSFLTGK